MVEGRKNPKGSKDPVISEINYLLTLLAGPHFEKGGEVARPNHLDFEHRGQFIIHHWLDEALVEEQLGKCLSGTCWFALLTPSLVVEYFTLHVILPRQTEYLVRRLRGLPDEGERTLYKHQLVKMSIHHWSSAARSKFPHPDCLEDCQQVLTSFLRPLEKHTIRVSPHQDSKGNV